MCFSIIIALSAFFHIICFFSFAKRQHGVSPLSLLSLLSLLYTIAIPIYSSSISRETSSVTPFVATSLMKVTGWLTGTSFGSTT